MASSTTSAGIDELSRQYIKHCSCPFNPSPKQVQHNTTSTMHLSAIVLALASSLTTSAAPLERRQEYTQTVNQSAPFYLRLQSRNTTYNGSYLFAGHAGAAIESFLPTTNKSMASTFNFNITNYGTSQDSSYNVTGHPGILTWTLVGGNFEAPSSAQFVYNPSTNVVPVQLYTGNDTATYLAFDNKGRLNYPYYNNEESEYQALRRFQICKQYTSGYNYISLAWIIGSNRPNNPTCASVQVVREFV